MIPAAFDYQRPTNLAEAARLLAAHADDAKILAGMPKHELGMKFLSSLTDKLLLECQTTGKTGRPLTENINSRTR